MASKDDRNFSYTLSGMPRTHNTNSSIIPNYSDRLEGSPKPIPIPGPPPKHLPFVRNVYAEIGKPTNPRLANPADKTFLNRQTKPGHNHRGSHRNGASRNEGKGKGKAIEVRRSSPSELIVIDEDEHPSTDDLNLFSKSPTTTSPYFNSKPGPQLQEDVRGRAIAGPSLVEDGPNTKRLQQNVMNSHRVSGQETTNNHRQLSSSPIQCFSDEEVATVKPNEPLLETTGLVKERVAKFESYGAKENQPHQTQLPVHNFRDNAKTRMKLKGGGRKLSVVPSDPLSEPSGIRISSETKLTNRTRLRIPISILRIGKQEFGDYDTIVIDNVARNMKFEGGSNMIGAIPITTDYFANFQCTDPHSLDHGAHPPILYFETISKAPFSPWEPHFSRSVFKPGAKNQGQISMRFNPTSLQWSDQVYQDAMAMVSRLISKKGFLRSTATKTLWTTLKNGLEFRSGDLDDSPCVLEDDELGDGSTRSPALSVSSDRHRTVTTATRHSGIDHRPAEPQESRSLPSDEPSSSIRKRLPQPDRRIASLSEAQGRERPSKRQRVEEFRPPRRSARHQEKSPSNDADEVILVYPYRVPGAVNITAGDLTRLQPEEFLNDTLIEFGLKSWLKELEVTSPDIASQVHVFNSFFYKKLNKRNIKEGYESVRKWTSKIDIFSKKYVVVPINEHLHWYLAIIYEPEHSLRTPPPHHPHTHAVTRQQAREIQSIEDKAEGEPAQTNIHANSDITPVQTVSNGGQDSPDSTNSEVEVERLTSFSSRAVTTSNEHTSSTDHASELEGALIKASTSGKRTPQLIPGSPMLIDNDIIPGTPEQFSKSGGSDVTMGSGANTPVEIPDDSQQNQSIETLAPAVFYGKPKTTRDRKKARESIGEPVAIDDTPRTKIFIFDSLGNRHPQAMKQLNKWLELEAIDKKNVENVTPALTKMALVPVQPNFCDCGLYVLHFTQTFMSDPQRYAQIIMTKERPTMAERQEDWKSDSVSQMRGNLQAQIIQFSEEWRQLRAAQAAQEEQNKKQPQQSIEDEEDSDVAIVGHMQVGCKKSKVVKSHRT